MFSTVSKVEYMDSENEREKNETKKGKEDKLQ